MNALALSVTKRLGITLLSFSAFVLTTSSFGVIPVVAAQDQVGVLQNRVATQPGQVAVAQNRIIAAPAATLSLEPVTVQRIVERSRRNEDRAGFRSWRRSLVPLAVSQTLDITSSYGMLERNPLLAGPNGRFGPKAATIKLATTGAIVGIEYLIVRKWPKSARILSKLNWSSSLLTAGLAMHNYAIK